MPRLLMKEPESFWRCSMRLPPKLRLLSICAELQGVMLSKANYTCESEPSPVEQLSACAVDSYTFDKKVGSATMTCGFP